MQGEREREMQRRERERERARESERGRERERERERERPLTPQCHISNTSSSLPTQPSETFRVIGPGFRLNKPL